MCLSKILNITNTIQRIVENLYPIFEGNKIDLRNYKFRCAKTFALLRSIRISASTHKKSMRRFHSACFEILYHPGNTISCHSAGSFHLCWIFFRFPFAGHPLLPTNLIRPFYLSIFLCTIVKHILFFHPWILLFPNHSW